MGRYGGYQETGMSVSGVMDTVGKASLANILVEMYTNEGSHRDHDDGPDDEIYRR